MRIREIEPERDADDMVELQRATAPFQLANRRHWLHRELSMPARIKLLHLVAEVGGRGVGEAWAGHGVFGGEQTVHLGVRVLPAYRRQGIGGRLYEAVLEHALALGSPDLLAEVDENEAGLAFAHARGFAETRAEVWSVLDTGAVEEQPDPAVELVPLRWLDPRDVHRVDEEATRDVPQHAPVEGIAYDEWLRLVWHHAMLSRDGSFGALVDGELAALSLLIADQEARRGVNMFTGTVPRHRGRGLALAAKLATTHWAAANGIAEIATTNDETNAAMLAINRRLGYRPASRRVELLAERERLLRERGEHL